MNCSNRLSHRKVNPIGLSSPSKHGIQLRKPGRRNRFSDSEERTIVNVLSQDVDRGVALTRRHLKEAFDMFIFKLPEARCYRLNLELQSPGPRILRDLEKRQAHVLCFNRPTRQEGERWKAVNAESLTMHFATVQRLIHDNSTDATRMWNLDETAGTPGRDVTGSTIKNRYLLRNDSRDVQIPQFTHTSSTAVMAVINVAGDTGPSLFELKGSKLQYRRKIVDVKVATETFVSHLPRGAVVAMRDEVGGV